MKLQTTHPYFCFPLTFITVCLCLVSVGTASAEEVEYLFSIGGTVLGRGQFEEPVGIALDHTGNIYVTDLQKNNVQVFDNIGRLQFQFDNNLKAPRGIAVNDFGLIYVAARENFRDDNYSVRIFGPTGDYLTSFGSTGSGNGQFNESNGIALGVNAEIYVTDWGNDRVQVFDSGGAYQFQFGNEGGGNGQFNAPKGIAVDESGDIYVADPGNHRVQVFDNAGDYLFQFGSEGSGNGQFYAPAGIAFDESGDIYVTDSRNDRVQVFDSTGAYKFQFGEYGTGNGQLIRPQGIAVDDLGRIYVADPVNQRVSVWQVAAAVPEPTAALFLCGTGALAGLRRRRRAHVA